MTASRTEQYHNSRKRIGLIVSHVENADYRFDDKLVFRVPDEAGGVF